jgi:hypothetical protein
MSSNGQDFLIKFQEICLMANDKLLVARLDEAAEVLQSLGSYCIDTSSQYKPVDMRRDLLQKLRN